MWKLALKWPFLKKICPNLLCKKWYLGCQNLTIFLKYPLALKNKFYFFVYCCLCCYKYTNMTQSLFALKENTNKKWNSHGPLKMKLYAIFIIVFPSAWIFLQENVVHVLSIENSKSSSFTFILFSARRASLLLNLRNIHWWTLYMIHLWNTIHSSPPYNTLRPEMYLLSIFSDDVRVFCLNNISLQAIFLVCNLKNSLSERFSTKLNV